MKLLRAAAAGGLIAALSLSACGDDDDASAPADLTTSTPQQTDVLELDVDVPAEVRAGPITWVIEVTNTADEEVSIMFPTSQAGDVTLVDDDEEIVHQWSEGQFFTQSTEEVVFRPGEKHSYRLEDDLSDVAPGSYRAVFELSTTHPPEPITQDIEVIAASE